MTYAKGACVLHMLRGLLGDDAWWKGIRGYVAAHKLQVVETDDFRKAMEAASGKDLKWFFDQWVYKAGHPELKVRWHYEDDDKTVRVQIEQTQKVDDQTPLFRLPTTLEITEDVGRTRAIPIVIDGASHEFVIPAAARPKMVQIDPEGWLIKELDFEKSEAENLFQLEHASCVLGRLDAARALAQAAKDKPEIARALSAAWKREKSVAARRELVELLGNGEEAFRAALLEAAKDPEARVRVAAIGGLAKLKRDDTTESILRAAWANPKEAYGARRAALRGLVAWKVEDAEAAGRRPQDPRRPSLDRRHGARAPAGNPGLAGPRARRALQPIRPARPPCDPRPSARSPAWPRTTRPSRTSSSPWSTTRTVRAVPDPGRRARAEDHPGRPDAQGPARRARATASALSCVDGSRRRSTP